MGVYKDIYRDASLMQTQLFNFSVKLTILLMGIKLFLDTIFFSVLNDIYSVLARSLHADRDWPLGFLFF